MRVAYRVPMPTMLPRGEQDLAYNPGAERWQQFFAPHSHLTFLAEVVQDDEAAEPWQEGDWLVVDQMLSLRDGVLVVVNVDEALYVYRYAHRINVPVLEGLDGQLWTGDLTNVEMVGLVSHRVQKVY